LFQTEAAKKWASAVAFSAIRCPDVPTIPPPFPDVFEQPPNSFAPMQKIRCIIQKRKNSIHIQDGEGGRLVRLAVTDGG
jgi:hypothetical protein